jgi:hypothetical protein
MPVIHFAEDATDPPWEFHARSVTFIPLTDGDATLSPQVPPARRNCNHVGTVAFCSPSDRGAHRHVVRGPRGDSPRVSYVRIAVMQSRIICRRSFRISEVEGRSVSM